MFMGHLSTYFSAAVARSSLAAHRTPFGEEAKKREHPCAYLGPPKRTAMPSSKKARKLVGFSARLQSQVLGGEWCTLPDYVLSSALACRQCLRWRFWDARLKPERSHSSRRTKFFGVGSHLPPLPQSLVPAPCLEAPAAPRPGI